MGTPHHNRTSLCRGLLHHPTGASPLSPSTRCSGACSRGQKIRNDRGHVADILHHTPRKTMSLKVRLATTYTIYFRHCRKYDLQRDPSMIYNVTQVRGHSEIPAESCPLVASLTLCYRTAVPTEKSSQSCTLASQYDFSNHFVMRPILLYRPPSINSHRSGCGRQMFVGVQYMPVRLRADGLWKNIHDGGRSRPRSSTPFCGRSHAFHTW